MEAGLNRPVPFSTVSKGRSFGSVPQLVEKAPAVISMARVTVRGTAIRIEIREGAAGIPVDISFDGCRPLGDLSRRTCGSGRE